MWFDTDLKVLEVEYAAMPEERNRHVILREIKVAEDKLVVAKRKNQYAGLNGSERSNNDVRVQNGS
jgi:hypothetical protein